MQCWPRTQTCFRRKISYWMLSWSAWAKIAKENYVYNLAKKNNLQFYLDLSGPTLHMEITCAMLTLCTQMYFCRKTSFCLVVCFLTGYIITEQSWLFLFNIDSGVHLHLAGQQWTGGQHWLELRQQFNFHTEMNEQGFDNLWVAIVPSLNLHRNFKPVGWWKL